jgi:thiol-disulfide isomerase/thioredoxin
MMRFIGTFALMAAVGLAAAGSAGAQSLGPAHSAQTAQHSAALSPSLQGKPVVARIHADWCPACKATQPTIDAIKAHYGNTISFVEFDVTDGKTSAAAAADAQRLGLGAFFEAKKTATSTVAVVNPKTGAIVATFYADSNAADYERAIDQTASELRKS